jgi:HEAT repeat protein
LQQKVDSLFVIASSGEVRFRDLTGPAMDSIAALGVDVVPLLIDKFTTKSALERWTVIWILQRIGSPAVPDLVKALNRPEGMVVERVCWALGDIKDTGAVKPLVEIMAHSRWQVREQAARALGLIGDERGKEIVVAALDDPIEIVRKAAAVSCGQLQAEAAIPVLVKQLGDEFYGARLAAAEALLALDTQQVVGYLEKQIDAISSMAGNVACGVLGKFGTDGAMHILLMQTKSPNAERRAHAAIAIIKADPEDNCGYHLALISQESDPLSRQKIASALAAVTNAGQ